MRTADRVWAVLIGIIGGFWIALLLRLGLGPMPVSFQVLSYWAVGGVFAGGVVGWVFPRIVTIALYPFTFLGGSSN